VEIIIGIDIEVVETEIILLGRISLPIAILNNSRATSEFQLLNKISHTFKSLVNTI